MAAPPVLSAPTVIPKSTPLHITSPPPSPLQVTSPCSPDVYPPLGETRDASRRTGTKTPHHKLGVQKGGDSRCQPVRELSCGWYGMDVIENKDTPHPPPLPILPASPPPTHASSSRRATFATVLADASLPPSAPNLSSPTSSTHFLSYVSHTRSFSLTSSIFSSESASRTPRGVLGVKCVPTKRTCSTRPPPALLPSLALGDGQLALPTGRWCPCRKRPPGC